MQGIVWFCFTVIVMASMAPVAYAQDPELPENERPEWFREGELRLEAAEKKLGIWKDPREWLRSTRLPAKEELEAWSRRDLNNLRGNVNEFLKLAAEISHYRFAPLSEQWAVKGVREESKFLLEWIDHILIFLLDEQPDSLGPTYALSELTIDEKLGLLNSSVVQVRPRLIRLVEGNILDIVLYREVIARLQGIRTLTEAILE